MAGLPQTRRRRTPGLRREEVAELADISTALYAWLEQGRDVPVSRRTVDAIANALQLTPAEREHANMLATHESSVLNETITDSLKRMVDSFHTHPIFILNHRWDVVLSNAAANVVFTNDSTAPNVNLLEAVFAEPTRSQFLDWREVAAALIEMFRFDYALYAKEPDALAIVERLYASDTTFAEIWDEHRVRRSPNSVRRIAHPRVGLLSLEPSLYAVVESPGLRVMMYTPCGDDTTRKIGGMVSEASRSAV
jgi:transcriptional regulator with XRE-family HTH domain